MPDAPLLNGRFVKLAGKNLNLFWGTYTGKIIPESQTTDKRAERLKLLSYVQDHEGVTIPDAEIAAPGSWPEHVKAGIGKTDAFGLKVRHGDMEAAIDQLTPNGDGTYDIATIRAIKQPKDEHYLEMAFQKHVMEQSGVKIRDCHMWLINPHYGKDEDRELMLRQIVTGGVNQADEKLAPLLDAMRKAKSNPDVRPTEDFCIDLDEPKLPPKHVFLLTQGRKKAEEAYVRGIKSLADWPDDIELSRTQQVQVAAAKTGEIQIDHGQMKAFFGKLRYPLHYLDFETCAPAVPIYPDTSPFQTIPFMFVNFKIEAPGAKPQIDIVIAKPGEDPRKFIADSLRDSLKDHGTVVVYNKTAEQGVLEDLAEHFPKEAIWVKRSVANMVDLYAPIRSYHFHHPDQDGLSLKSMMRTLAGVTYDELAIREGSQAEETWLRMHEMKDPAAIEPLIQGLKIYCAQDASGMALVENRLREIVTQKAGANAESLAQERSIPKTKLPEVVSVARPMATFAELESRGEIPTF